MQDIAYFGTRARDIRSIMALGVILANIRQRDGVFWGGEFVGHFLCFIVNGRGRYKKGPHLLKSLDSMRRDYHLRDI